MAKRKPRRAATSRKKPGTSSLERWVKTTLSRMSLDEKLGQLLVVPFFGRFAPHDDREAAKLSHYITDLHVGGLMLHTGVTPLGLERGDIYATAAIINQCQKSADIPLLVAADFERGTAMRLVGGTSFPHAMAVAATGSPKDAYEVGRITALEARAVGIHWIFAPDADVNSNPANPIINTRSYGEDPKRVAKFVAEFIRGVEENGGLATAKHFPGHGDTSTDSHLDLPRVTANRARLDNIELVPFRAAISANVGSVMTGHLAVPALDSDSEIPATLSHRVLTDLLRNEMDFPGLIVTDALDMDGVAARFSPGEAAVRAVLAGADVLLLSPSPDGAIAALHEAVASGRLLIARVDASVGRILRAKARLGLHTNLTRDAERQDLDKTIAQHHSVDVAQGIADRGITLLRDTPGIIPLNAAKPLRVLLVSIDADPDFIPGESFESEIRWRVDSLQAIHVDTRFAPASNAKLPLADSYDVAVAALFVRVADRKGNIGLPKDQIDLVERLQSQKKPLAVVCFGSPYLIERFPNAPTWLAAFSTADVAQRAAARALFDHISIRGELPVRIPGAKPPLKIGDGLSRVSDLMLLHFATEDRQSVLNPVWTLLDRAVEDAAFPGGTIAVGLGDELWLHAFGRHTYEKNSPAVVPETIYDLASLTKPVVTTTLAAMEVEAGNLDLDSRLGLYLPEWESGDQLKWRERVTLRHLLTHTSGLRGKAFYYESLKTKRQVIAAAISERLIYEPGAKVEYSDPGFILLGEIIERMTGMPLDDLAQSRIIAPLCMQDTYWNPWRRSLRSQIAPTGTDTSLRKRLPVGEVNDDNAWVMGGVAGHAGLFSTASGLAHFCRMMLNGGIFRHHRFLRRATVTEFTSAQPLAGNTRALGWVVPTEPSSSGKYFSSRSFGHAGFTGTSIWCDPEKDLFVVLLTNRTYPSRANEKIQQVRPAIHDAVAEALGFTELRASTRPR
ncbi:MAG TPA: glycoside hydrolase family 3 N-terminal domain-containing protein [Candidatus Acidoferrales bacterium]|nr:glycoside hydrolase family 3 N-terminal domain-containing protein [Candidatus Acidoferrales bacterium]